MNYEYTVLNSSHNIKGPFKNYVTAKGGRGGLRKCYRVLCGGGGVLRHALRNRADFSGDNYFVKKWHKPAPKRVKE